MRLLPRGLMLAAVAMAAVGAGGAVAASGDKAIPANISLAAGEDVGIPWRGHMRGRRSGHGGKGPRQGKGRSQMARKAQRRARRKRAA